MSAHASTPGIHLQNLVLDDSFTSEQKVDCLKVLKLIIKNLADPVKAQDAKYRQIKLNNEKIASKLEPIAAAIDYLTAIGFAEAVQDSVPVLRVEEPNVVFMKASLQEVSNALDMVSPNDTKKPVIVKRLRHGEEEKKSDDIPEAKSEKQKARALLEEKQTKEKEEARKQRAVNVALLKQDKHVRKHDENWKSGVSAAMAKSGDGIETFRDRHGEHD